MTPDEAAWVREHAWTQQMRREPVFLPGSSSMTYDKAEALARCVCMVGVCFHCSDNRHEFCHARPGTVPGMPRPEYMLGNVSVWLADRVCRSQCPCDCPKTWIMTDREAAWVRANAWTKTMRKTHAEVPGFYTRCACEWSGPCLNDPRPGVHEICHMGVPISQYETIIEVRGGQAVAAFAQPYRHPTASATGWHLSHLAMVWIANRRCRWRCACDCGHPRTDIAHAPDRNPARPIVYQVVVLPGLDLLPA